GVAWPRLARLARQVIIGKAGHRQEQPVGSRSIKQEPNEETPMRSSAEPTLPPVDADYVTRTLVDLVRINSTNPLLTPGSPGEGAIGARLAEMMDDLGLDVTTYDLGEGRVNVVGVLHGQGDGPSLLLNGHMDTVGV